MPESKTRLQYLYEQFVHDNATANEVAEFWALLQKADENDAVSHSVFQEYNNSNSAQESTSVNWAIVLDKIFKTNESEKNVALRLRKQISFYAAAILFLFLYVVAYGFGIINKPHNSLAIILSVKTKNQDIAAQY